MNNALKTLAIAGLMGSLSAPAFAAAHLDLNSMTCEEYNQLGGVDRDKVAMMAIAELNENVTAGDGTATATASSEGSAATESTGTVSDGTATATSTAGAGDDMTRFQEEVAVFNRVCSRNWDTMVLDAAAGGRSSR